MSVESLSYPMPFGKHKGTPLEKMPRGYLIWLTGLKDIREPLKTHIKTVLATKRAEAQRDPKDKVCEACGQPAYTTRYKCEYCGYSLIQAEGGSHGLGTRTTESSSTGTSAENSSTPSAARAG